jgi:RNA polymerase sigma factor (TIGR02999 family)
LKTGNTPEDFGQVLDRAALAGEMASPQQVTELLLAWNRGQSSALEELMPLVHNELQRLAHHYMGGQRPGHTLQTTALVNEAYLRLVDCSRVRWQNRAHFFAVSAQLMRRILVDFARSRGYLKRGAGVRPLSLEKSPDIFQRTDPDLLALDDALNALAVVDPRKSQVIELRFLGGLTAEETAEVLNVSPDTVLRDWKLAKAWLHRELSRAAPHEA